MKINSGSSGMPFNGTVHGVILSDSGTLEGKLTAWYLPRKYNWQPQMGCELDFTRFTADLDPQLRGMDGTVAIPGFQLGAFGFSNVRDLSVNTLGANLLFRYPIWSTPDLPQGRRPIRWLWCRRTASRPVPPGRSVSRSGYFPAGQLLVGMKFFVMKNLGVFGEYKRIWSSHDFTYSGSGIMPPGYEETWFVVTNVLAGGLSLHF
jgi:hypothetical protein